MCVDVFVDVCVAGAPELCRPGRMRGSCVFVGEDGECRKPGAHADPATDQDGNDARTRPLFLSRSVPIACQDGQGMSSTTCLVQTCIQACEVEIRMQASIRPYNKTCITPHNSSII